MNRAELIDLVSDLEKTATANEVQQNSNMLALRDSEARLRAILETAVEGIVTISERGIIESFNPAAEKIFGYKAQEVIGQNIKILMPEPYRHEHDGYLNNYVRGGEARIIGIGREVSGRRHDGSIFPMDLSVSEVRLADRRIFTGFIRDITERKAAEKAMLYFASLVESSDDAIIGKTLDGHITSWNSGAETIFGFSHDEAVGAPISIIIPGDRIPEEQAILEKIGRGESIEHFETIRKRKDGRMVDISVTISPIREQGGKIVGASKVARNITERKRLENEILEISEREQRRIGSDLHDGLCQELAGVELMCQVLEQKLEAKSKTESKQAADIATHIRGAITHTRRLARGLSPVELEKNGLVSALHELAGTVQNLYRIECRLECPDTILIRNNTYATHLFRIAQEAVNNAIKHGKARQIIISLKPTGSRVEMAVKDDGGGISPTPPKSKGMGLHIMKYRAGAVGGTLEIEGAAGKGTTVVCNFPKNI